jgi:signal transduction histidine kinase
LRTLTGLLLVSAVWAAIGYPTASPGGEMAVIVGIATVIALMSVGVSMQADEGRERQGKLLVYAGSLSSLWLLVGSDVSFAFSVGRLYAGLITIVFAYLILAYPTGRLHSRAERLFLAVVGIPLATSWIAIQLTSPQPPFVTPLLRCAPNCPTNVFFIGHSAIAGPLLWGVARAAWLVLACGLAVIMLGRLRRASDPVRQCLAPVALWTGVYALSLAGFLLTATLLPSAVLSQSLRSVSIAIVPAIPLVMLLGSTTESLFMGRALSALVTRLGEDAAPDLQRLMAECLHDPSLRILYRRPTVDAYLDSSGATATKPVASATLGVTPIEHERRLVAVVVHDVELSDQKRFIAAAGAAGVIWFRNAQLAADLKASIADLAASRARIVETADAERQRIEHRLHDGAQQHLVGMRLRLELAAEMVENDPRHGTRMLAEIGAQMDEALDDVRNLAKGVYPPLLPEHGLGEALRSVNRRSPWPASLDVRAIGRYPADTEAAVYFCCLEALQNITKHAGPAVGGAIHLWEDAGRLHFEVSDEGVGFSVDPVGAGQGLVNMRDRIESAGGTVTVASRTGLGTVVRGSVPAAPVPAPLGSA